MKKAIAFLLALTLVFGLLPAAALAANGTPADLGWSTDGNNFTGWSVSDGVITGVTVTDASDETPGLGSKATLPSYTDQFVGATAIQFNDASGDGTRIDGVSGATYTSTAVFTAVNAAIAQFAELGGAL